MISLQIDTSGMQRAAAQLDASTAQINAAMRSTLGKMARWSRTQSLRQLSSRLAIQQKLLRPRLKAGKVKRSARGAQVALWYGLNPVALIHLGARQTRQGVRARGGRQVDGAFIAQARNGKRQVFKRKGRARLPIAVQAAAIEEKASNYIEKDLADSRAFEQRFLKTFEHELQWRMRKQ